MQTDSSRGVSPVIGVVLLIGLSVVLAATTAVFALDLAASSQPADPTPWDADAPNTSFSMLANGDQLLITHAGGDDARADHLSIEGDLADGDRQWADGGTVSDGDSVGVVLAGDDPEVRIVWRDGTGESAVLGTQE